jgi:hypothetical protein
MIKAVIKNLSNLPGWRTNRKIVVIESDDWGSIRMPSKETFNSLKKAGITLESGDSARYNNNDTLATAEDFQCLFETLQKFKDRAGNNPVFTAVSIVANPDFEKIKAHDFQEYFYEPFTETLKKYNQENAIKMWKEGVDSKLFIPEFHGREHLNVKTWMRALQNGDSQTRIAFEHGCWGFNRQNASINYQAAFDIEKPEDLDYQKSVIKEGLELFNKLHGYKCSFFVPPNGPFNTKMEKTLSEQEIKYISTSKIHTEPLGNQKFNKKMYWLGKKNIFGQTYLTRNAFFEPNSKSKNWVDSCLSEIDSAFKWGKPVNISSHRCNYVGNINISNRDLGLAQLEILLASILKKWPEVEFMSAKELGDVISTKSK